MPAAGDSELSGGRVRGKELRLLQGHWSPLKMFADVSLCLSSLLLHGSSPTPLCSFRTTATVEGMTPAWAQANTSCGPGAGHMRTTSAQDRMDWRPDKPWLGSCSKNTTLLGGDSGCGSLCGVHWVGHGLGAAVGRGPALPWRGVLREAFRAGVAAGAQLVRDLRSS